MTTKPWLTVGMAVYDDYDGVYFTIQHIRLMFADLIEHIHFVVVDNKNDSESGRATGKFITNYVPNATYVPFTEFQSTAVRNLVFEHAEADYVMCIDSHVLLPQYALHKLIHWFRQNHDRNALVQGPLWYDGLDNTISTHFEPTWRADMYGIWGTDPRGTSPDADPFVIQMQGLGLFAMAKKFWPGFNPLFRGFGGEEGYIHEKVRQRGGETLCLPFLRWVHRFDRPLGTPYKLTAEDKVRNYFLGHIELGWPIDPILAHFKTKIPLRKLEQMAAHALSELISQKIVPAETFVKRTSRPSNPAEPTRRIRPVRTARQPRTGLMPSTYV